MPPIFAFLTVVVSNIANHLEIGGIAALALLMLGPPAGLFIWLRERRVRLFVAFQALQAMIGQGLMSIGFIITLVGQLIRGQSVFLDLLWVIPMACTAVWAVFWFCGSLLALQDIRDGDAPVFPIVGSYLERRGWDGRATS